MQKEKVSTIIDVMKLLTHETKCECGYKAKDIHEAYQIDKKGLCEKCINLRSLNEKTQSKKSV